MIGPITSLRFVSPSMKNCFSANGREGGRGEDGKQLRRKGVRTEREVGQEWWGRRWECGEGKRRERGEVRRRVFCVTTVHSANGREGGWEEEGKQLRR